MLSWKNSGFSSDNSVRIYGCDKKARESLAQYIARAPVSLEKLKYEPFHGKVLFKTLKYNDYFKENFKSFDVLDFIALVTAHIPPKHKQYIRRYGLYSSRSHGKWKEHKHLCRLAPEGWREKQDIAVTVPQEELTQETPAIGTKQQQSAWARLIKKVYGVDPLVCPKCGSEMKIIALIMDPEETTKILRHLVKIGRAPPNFNPDSINLIIFFFVTRFWDRCALDDTEYMPKWMLFQNFRFFIFFCCLICYCGIKICAHSSNSVSFYCVFCMGIISLAIIIIKN